MALFGIGTIPLMTTAIYLGNFLTNNLKQRILKAIPVVVIVIGLLFILRGLGLGIPYLSPSEMVAVEQISSQQECH
jgi:sulfite exporter TauE/SafE